MAVIATQSNYSMGQHRSNSEKPETYCSSIETININEGFAIKDSEKNDDLPFRDPCFNYSKGFEIGTTYFLRLKINKHVFKDMTYAIKLVNLDSNNNYNENDYQYLKRVTVFSENKGVEESVAIVTVYRCQTDSNNKYRYFSSLTSLESSSENPEAYSLENSFEISEDEKFVNLKYLGAEKEEDIASFKISLLDNESSENASEIVEILFTPTKKYSGIIIEKERDNSDWTTFYEDEESGKSFNGFETSASFINLYSLNNLLSTDSQEGAIVAKPNKISKIGVWGRSNLCLNCNGEEIRIGPRGYYEMSFDETLGLSSFGVLAESESDFPFLIDYEYILS